MHEEKIRVICNPASGGGDYDPDELKRLLGETEVEWILTEDEGDAERYAREWTEGLLVVAGGDGTVNEAVNGLGKAGFPENVTLAILPSGTGNDLAQTLAIPEEPEEAIKTVRDGRVREIDAARVESTHLKERYFVNVATGGFGAEASSMNDEEMKIRWGKFSYLRATLEVARKHEPRDALIVLDGEERQMRAANVAVGNCRYAGGGWLAVPNANPEDGLLDVVVIGDLGLKGMLGIAPAALNDSFNYLDAEGVFHARAKEVRVETSPEGLAFTADGEVIGDEPVTFTVIPGALKVIVGADYTPEPDTGREP